MKLSKKHQALHQRAVSLSRRHREVEWEMIEVLREIEAANFLRLLDCQNLFVYAVKELKLTESTAYMFQSVSKKVTQVPALGEALRMQDISVARASRLVSVINDANAAELIEFAKTHTQREVDFEVARRNPKPKKGSSIRPKSGETARVSVDLSKAAIVKLKRAQTLMSKNGQTEFPDVMEAALDTWLDQNDPVRKAERAHRRAEKKASAVKSDEPVPGAEEKALQPAEQFCAHRTPVEFPRNGPIRKPLTAEQKHAVFASTQGRCTYMNARRERCNSDRWVDVHHKILVSEGGTNDPENLTVLCSFHHDLVHQLNLPLEVEAEQSKRETEAGPKDYRC